MPTSVESSQNPILPAEGLHVVHLFFRIDHGLWDLHDARGRIEAKTSMAELVQEIRAEPHTQLLTFSILSPKADVGFLLLTPDLHVADSFSKRLALALGPEILTPEFAFLSIIEVGGFSGGHEPMEASPGFEGEPATADATRNTCLIPLLPDWPVVCFYAMSLRNSDGPNELEAGKNLVASNVDALVMGRVIQMVTDATGLDDMDWGVTLFARSASEIRETVSRLRSEKQAMRGAEFGGCFIGLQMPLDQLFARLGL